MINRIIGHTYDDNAALVSGMADRGLRYERCGSERYEWVVG